MSPPDEDADAKQRADEWIENRTIRQVAQHAAIADDKEHAEQAQRVLAQLERHIRGHRAVRDEDRNFGGMRIEIERMLDIVGAEWQKNNRRDERDEQQALGVIARVGAVGEHRVGNEKHNRKRNDATAGVCVERHAGEKAGEDERAPYLPFSIDSGGRLNGD